VDSVLERTIRRAQTLPITHRRFVNEMSVVLIRICFFDFLKSIRRVIPYRP